LDIIAPNGLTSQQIVCGNKSLVGSPAATNPAGTSGLSYQAQKDKYTYAWQTDTAWAGTCRQVTLTLNDGTQYVAYFQYR
jgi:hypothetical protein